jgi:hypothetical protein
MRPNTTRRAPFDRDYEARRHDYYGRKGYWSDKAA